MAGKVAFREVHKITLFFPDEEQKITREWKRRPTLAQSFFRVFHLSFFLQTYSTYSPNNESNMAVGRGWDNRDGAK